MTELTVKDVVITDDMRDALKGYLGFEPESTFLFVPKAYREKKEDGSYRIPKALWPVYRLKSKDGLESAKLEDDAGYLAYDKEKGQSQLYLESGKERISTLRAGIKGWKNWLREDFKSEIPFHENMIGTDGLLREKHIKDMPVRLQVELQNAINERSILTQEELSGLEF